MVTCRLMVLSALSVAIISADVVLAQSTFPAPLPGQGATTSPSAALPLAGIAPAQSSECIQGFTPLREDAEKKGKLIKAAGERHAPPDEACKLIKNYSSAEVKMIEYVETNSGKCGIPAQVAEQLKSGHRNTEGLQNRVCAIAEQAGTRGSGPSLNDVLDPPQTQKRWPLGDYPDWIGRH